MGYEHKVEHETTTIFHSSSSSSSEALLFATNMLYSKLARSFTRRSSLSRHCLLYNGRRLAIFGEEATNSVDSSRLGFLRGYLTSSLGAQNQFIKKTYLSDFKFRRLLSSEAPKKKRCKLLVNQAEVLERAEGIRREYEELDTVWFMAGSLFQPYPYDIPTEALLKFSNKHLLQFSLV